MGAVVNPTNVRGISMGNEFFEVLEPLRQVTVRISDGSRGCGSGVVWSADGVIVTNAHVARSGRRQKIEFIDGRTFVGSVIAIDERRDLAALHISARELLAAQVRDGYDLRTGEFVLAVGNPAAELGAVTTGILHRAPASREFVLADMRLAPGYSGGPLADAQGRVIGINSMMVGGFGCAIPSNVVAGFLHAYSVAEVA